MSRFLTQVEVVDHVTEAGGVSAAQTRLNCSHRDLRRTLMKLQLVLVVNGPQRLLTGPSAGLGLHGISVCGSRPPGRNAALLPGGSIPDSSVRRSTTGGLGGAQRCSSTSSDQLVLKSTSRLTVAKCSWWLS